VNLAGGELTLYVGELYAGRFAFTIGDERPQPGTYRVQTKQKDRPYIGRDGRQIAGGDPANPYGNCWIDLGKEVSLHGSGISNGQGPALGCLSFSPQDAQDLCGILSVTSEVVVK
jgi:lipoprotein-anchoring transpeptidase ErfK/SrfK